MIKKILISFLFTMTLLISTSYVSAKQESPPEQVVVVEDEQTPKAAPQKNNNYQYFVIMVALQAALVVILYKVYEDRHKKVKLNITGITSNGDGSYLVKWGYYNPMKKSIVPEHYDLNVTKGSAILLKKTEDKVLKPGINDEVMITVINKNTSLEWVVDDQKITLDGKDIDKKDGESI